ncbi:MAG TPA: ABC transporter permease [Terracidiphilus sp.]|jgi:predicted permease
MLKNLIAGVRALRRPDDRNGQIEEELKSFFDASVEDKIQSGMTPERAQQAARIEIGSGEMVRHKVWSASWESRIDSLLREVRLAVRRMRNSPGFAVTAVLMLALGIGATTTIFSIVDGVLLRPLPFPNAERLVTLGDQLNGQDWGKQDPGLVTAPEVVVYPRDTHSFQSLGGYGYSLDELSGIGEPAIIWASRMTPSVFSALGVAPLLGRVFTAEEDQNKEQVVVLSYATWKSRFNGDPHILGTKVLFDRKPYLVIGVMPSNFEFPLSPGRLDRVELWVPISLSSQQLSAEAFGNWGFFLVGRLKPGVTPTQAQDDADRVAQQIMRTYPPDISNFRIKAVVYPLQQITVLETRPLLRMLFLAVVVVLFIACANFAGLLLVRAIRRQRETTVRLALGAPARTLLWQTILESLILSVIGGTLGIRLAALAVTIGRNFLPETMPLVDNITLNWTVVAFAFLLAVFTGFFCGLAPGFAALRTNVNAGMKEGGRSGSAGGSHARLRSTFIVMEIAIALVLLTASGLLMRSFSKMSAVDLGFRPDHVGTAFYALPRTQYSTQAQIDNFNNKLLQQLRQLPGFQSVGLTDTLPTADIGGGRQSFVADGYVNPRGSEQTVAARSLVIGHYFKAIGIPLIHGRYFNKSDDATNQLVVIVNREFAEDYWPSENPIGKRMRLGTQKMATPWMTVVGEVADAKLYSPDSDAVEQFYQPVAQSEKDRGPMASPTDLYGSGNYIVMRSALPPEQMENVLRAIVRSLDAQLPLTQVQTMEQVVGQSEADRRFNTVVISSFALAAVLLAVLGIYSIMAFSVASRAQEMAIRIALGAKRGDILRLVLISGAKLAAVGAVIGLAGAAATSGFVRSFLFQVSPFDPVVLVLAAIAVLALALMASVIPARRAAAVDPIEALRGE